MANESTITSLNDLLPSIVAEAMFIAEEQSLMRNLVKNYTVALGSGTTVTVPKYARQTAVGLTQGADMLNTEITTSSAVLTVAEVGIMATVTDLARRTSASAVIADVGKLCGEAIARKMDADLCALFGGFSTVVGSNLTQLTAAHVFEAVSKLRAASVSSSDLVCVLHPEVAYDLKFDIAGGFADANAGDAANQAMVNGFVGRLAGIPVFESANIVSTAGDSIGGVFSRDALGLAVLSDINIEVQRDASLRADELVATATYGVGELEDTYGIGMSFDSSIV